MLAVAHESSANSPALCFLTGVMTASADVAIIRSRILRTKFNNYALAGLLYLFLLSHGEGGPAA